MNDTFLRVYPSANDVLLYDPTLPDEEGGGEDTLNQSAQFVLMMNNEALYGVV